LNVSQTIEAFFFHVKSFICEMILGPPVYYRIERAGHVS